MTNEQIVQKIKDGQDKDGQLIYMLFNNNAGIINKFITPFLPWVEREDAEQAAFIALYAAIDNYDETRSKFITFYEFYVRKELHKCKADNNALYLTAEMESLYFKYKELIKEYERQTGSRPTHKQIQYGLDISPAKVKELLKLEKALCPESINAPIPGADNGTIGDIIPGGSFEDDLIDKLQKESLAREIWQAVDDLDDRTGEMIRRHYEDQETYAAIGETMECSNENVRRCINTGLKKIRTGDHMQKLKSYYEEEQRIIADAYKGNTSAYKRNHTSSTERAAMRLYEHDLLFLQELRERLLKEREEREKMG